MTNMKVELQDEYSTPNPDEIAALAARGDYLDESLVNTEYDAVMEDRDLQEYLNDKVYRGHWGVFEHPQASFFVEGISRVAMAQITRHRHMSFDVQSQRYVDFEDKEPVVPPSFTENYMGGVRADAVLEGFWEDAIKRYNLALDGGIPKEDARFFLPQATPVNMTFSANPRSLFHFLDLRENAKAQWEAREFASAVHEVASEWAPKSFQAYEEKSNDNSLRAP